jgi:hypothetical protein
MKMASAYNPYSDIEKVYNAKVAWNNATTESERKKQNEIATAARNKLAAYGYGDVVEQISAAGADATATRKVLESYAPKETTTTTSGSNSGLIEKNNTEVNNKVNELWGIQTDDHSNTNALWEKEYNDLKKTNPFTTEEAKAILGKYDLSGLQARDNAVASGGSSNGGNIDSYAASNALRQQAALVNQGQMVVLDAHQQKLDNARAILEGMGVYQQNSYKGMQDTIGIQQTEGQRLFENDETAKNNDVARKSEIASVTGYTPTEWTYDNNIYLNSDGTVKAEFLTDEFDNTGGFTTIINNAKAKLATTTDPTERANLQATINAATQAKALKTFSSPKYSKYAHEVENVTPQQTEVGRQFDKNDATVRESLKTESDNARYEIDANKSIADSTNATNLALADKEIQGQKEIMTHQKELEDTTTSYTLTDEDKNMAELVAKNINDNLRTHESNPDKRDLITYKNGTMSLNLPTGHIPHWWATQILKPLFQSNLNYKACYTIARNLGFSEEDITSVAYAIK